MDNRFLNETQLRIFTTLGRTRARELARDADAVIRIGGRVLYDKQKIEEYIEGQRDAGDR